MSNYEGMRWFKCDLQMQTPADSKNWRGVPMGESEAEQNAAAECYIRRCYEVGLEAIAVTDHNFLSKDFIPLLRRSIDRLCGEYGYAITLFPGFEFTADVGKGVHVLAIFEPDTALDEIDHLLTECGVGYPRLENGVLKKSTKRLPELLEIVQGFDSGGRQKGLIILPHAMKDDGIFDKEKISDWLQREVFLNPDLLAVEVPKPVSTMNPNWQALFEANDFCDPAWRRERRIACIMSSDNKALTAEENRENYIGKRYSWIKMSRPSIEALRQAFLDPDSRIDLLDNPITDIQRPNKEKSHPHVHRIAVKNLKFLADQELVFSPSLTTIIGGRGSGKSTLLECLRLALSKGESPADSKLAKQLERIQKTFTPETEIRVEWERIPGQPDSIVFQPMKGQHQLDAGECADFRTYLNLLPVQFFSQQQLSDLAGQEQDCNRLLSLLDAACGAELQALASREATLRTAVQQSFAARDQLTALSGNIIRLKQELAELDRQWLARQEMQQDALTHQRALAARLYAQFIRTRADEMRHRILALAEDVGDSHVPLGSGAAHWPHADWFEQLDENAENLVGTIKGKLLECAMAYQQALAEMFDNNAEWIEISADLSTAEGRFFAACEARGLQPQDVSRLQEIDRQRQAKQQELASQENQARQLETQQPLLQQRLDELHALWQEQYRLRLAAADQINGKAKAIRVSVQYLGDKAAFTAIWNRLAPDGRSKLGKNWDELGEHIFGRFGEQQDYPSPWELLLAIVQGKAALPPELAEWLAPLREHLSANLAKWRETRLTRVADFVDIELRRAEDGSRVGSVSGTELSEGQRNTAVLNLLLAQGNGPIVIDQPEDELDSNFIYYDLVPLLRRIKNQRQLILATHNANLPVNADAELIYALEAKGGRGCVRAQGGLDRREVSQAVLDIMEGSAEAFRRRREKYHF